MACGEDDGGLDALLERLPDDWVEEHRGQQRVKASRQRESRRGSVSEKVESEMSG